VFQAVKAEALRPIRRLDVAWTGKETDEYDQLAKMAKKEGRPLPEFVKAVLRKRGLK
jgi:hypothetical protein